MYNLGVRNMVRCLFIGNYLRFKSIREGSGIVVFIFLNRVRRILVFCIYFIIIFFSFEDKLLIWNLIRNRCLNLLW